MQTSHHWSINGDWTESVSSLLPSFKTSSIIRRLHVVSTSFPIIVSPVSVFQNTSVVLSVKSGGPSTTIFSRFITLICEMGSHSIHTVSFRLRGNVEIMRSQGNCNGFGCGRQIARCVVSGEDSGHVRVVAGSALVKLSQCYLTLRGLLVTLAVMSSVNWRIAKREIFGSGPSVTIWSNVLAPLLSRGLAGTGQLVVWEGLDYPCCLDLMRLKLEPITVEVGAAPSQELQLC